MPHICHLLGCRFIKLSLPKHIVDEHIEYVFNDLAAM